MQFEASMSSKRINLISGIKKVSQLVNPIVHLNARARKLVERILRNLNDMLIIFCQSKFNPSKRNRVMKVSIAENAVVHVLKGDLTRYALATGNRSMLLYHSGLLCYKPTDKSLKRKKIKRILHLKFSKGISTLKRITFPEATFQAKGKDLICMVLHVLSTKICDESKKAVQSSNILEIDHIKTAVGNVLPEVMRQHAEAEGAKTVLLLETGSISLVCPQKRRAKTPLMRSPAKRSKDTSKTKISNRRHKSAPAKRTQRRLQQVGQFEKEECEMCFRY